MDQKSRNGLETALSGDFSNPESDREGRSAVSPAAALRGPSSEGTEGFGQCSVVTVNAARLLSDDPVTRHPCDKGSTGVFLSDHVSRVMIFAVLSCYLGSGVQRKEAYM